MAEIDIENPGADEADLRAAIGRYTGQVLLSTHVVSASVDYLDITLNAEYSFFRLLFLDFQMEVGDILALALSADGGTTFLNNNVDYDSYEVQVSRIYTPNRYDTAIQGFKGNDALISLTRTSDDGAAETFATEYGRTADVLLFAGATGRKASVMSTTGGTTGPGGEGPFMDSARAYASVTGRFNLMRILSYGNADCNPPTSGFHLTGGTVLLYGVA